MSTENKPQQEQIDLELVDLINAARIMEHAVSRNAFQIEELVSVAPVVSKFVKFANKALADIEAEKSEEARDVDGFDDKPEHGGEDA